MAEAVEAPSAMDGWPSADSVEKLFSFSGAFVRAAVTIDQPRPRISGNGPISDNDISSAHLSVSLHTFCAFYHERSIVFGFDS